jgi:hypothetical protein
VLLSNSDLRKQEESVPANSAMTSFGLSSLKSVGGLFFLAQNAVLDNLGLDSLETVGGSTFNVTNCPALNYCDAKAVFDGLTIAPPVVDFEPDNQGAGTTCP